MNTQTRTPAQKKTPLLCSLNVRHHWHVETSPDGDRYQRCTRCGKERTDYPETHLRLL